MVNRTKLTDKTRRMFLEALAESGNVSGACRRIDMSRTRLYGVRTEDTAFAAAWDAAVESAVDALEAEARRRALEGWDDPVFYQGQPVGVVRRYSDRLLEMLLKAHRPERFRDRVDMTVSGTGDLETRLKKARDRVEASRQRED